MKAESQGAFRELQSGDVGIRIVSMRFLCGCLMPESDGDLVFIGRGKLQGLGKVRLFFSCHGIQDTADNQTA